MPLSIPVSRSATGSEEETSGSLRLFVLRNPALICTLSSLNPFLKRGDSYTELASGSYEFWKVLNPISNRLFYLVVALVGGGVPPLSIKLDPDILEHGNLEG